MRNSAALRLSNSLRIHMRDHQNIFSQSLDHNRGDKPGIVEFGPEFQSSLGCFGSAIVIGQNVFLR